MADDLREVARRQNERDGLGPITDPAVLRKVARLIVAWQERQSEQACRDTSSRKSTPIS